MQPYDESVSDINPNSLLFNTDLSANYMCNDNPRNVLCNSQQNVYLIMGKLSSVAAYDISCNIYR